jgi:flagellar protein FliS
LSEVYYEFFEISCSGFSIFADILCMDKQNADQKGKNMYGSVAHDIYAQNNIGIESPHKLVEMMYEGVLRFNAQAKKAIKDENIEKKTYWINRAVAVIAELISVLDVKQGDIALYLDGLYNYEIRLLMQANMNDDSSKLDEVSNVFKSLLEVWREKTHVE